VVAGDMRAKPFMAVDDSGVGGGRMGRGMLGVSGVVGVRIDLPPQR